MKVVVAYVYPDLKANIYHPMARRFVESYMSNPPGTHDHEIHVLVTLGRAGNPAYARRMSPLTCSFMMHNNDGKDIGAFQQAAEQIECDLLVCLGAPIHFHKPGWLDRIINVYEQNGPGLYGCWGFHQPREHLRTTAFWTSPEIIKAYPYSVHNDSRYEFEHGAKSFHNIVKAMGIDSYMVTWDGCYPPDAWHHVTRDQCLLLDQHCDRTNLQ
jgi:hypothetical protein